MSFELDLVALVADKDMEHTLLGLLKRHQALGIRPIKYQILPHPGKDPACRTDSHNLLRIFHRKSEHAVVLFDHEGCGRESTAPEQIEHETEETLRQNGWHDRAAAIVMVPELEIWLWTHSRQLDDILGWSGASPGLREWLVQRGYLETEQQSKPNRPKEAFRAAIREKNKKPSAALFQKLAEHVSFRHCQDRAFNKLQSVLRDWFPPDTATPSYSH